MIIKQTIEWHTEPLDIEKLKDSQLILANFDGELIVIQYRKESQLFYEFFSNDMVENELMSMLKTWAYFEFPEWDKSDTSEG